MYLSASEKLWLEEQMNLLVTDPELSAIRYRAPNWVNARLEQALTDRLRASCNMTDAQWKGFLDGQEPDFSQTQQQIFQEFYLSRQEQREITLLAKADKPAAAARIRSYLLKKERTALGQRAGLTATAWLGFLNVSRYTGENVLDSISAALGLTPEEDAAFRALVFRDTFEPTEALKKHVRSLIQAQADTLTEFLLNADISENAWEPFRTNPKGKPTSQATMLKLIVGLHMDPSQGADLLHWVNSDFVMRRDLAVLICLRNGIYDHGALYVILEHFADAYGGRRYYKNLYEASHSVF